MSATVVGCLTGCATNPPSAPTPADIKAQFDAIYEVSVTPVQFKSKTLPASNRLISASEYAQVAYTSIDNSCRDFFSGISKASNGVQMSKGDWLAVGTAAAAIIALTHTGSSKAVGVSAAAFALGGTGFDNYQKYALLTAYPDQTRTLVQQAMRAYRTAAPPEGSTDIFNANSRVSGYADLCSYAGIMSMAAQAISTANVQAKSPQVSSVFSSSDDQNTIKVLASDLGLSEQTISDKDLALLALMTDSKTDPKLLPQIAAQLPPTIGAAVWDASTSMPKQSVLDKLAPMLAGLTKSNTAFAQAVAAIKAASQSKPSRPGDVKPGDPVLVIPASLVTPWQAPALSINGAAHQ